MFGKFRVFSQGDTRNEKPKAAAETKPPASATPIEKKVEADQAIETPTKETKGQETPIRPTQSQSQSQSQTQTQTQSPVQPTNTPANAPRSSDYILTSPRSAGERTNVLGFTPKDPDEDSVSSTLEEFAHVKHAYAGTELLNRYIAQRALIRNKARDNAQKAVKVDAAVVKAFEVCSQHNNSLYKFCEELQSLPKIKDSLSIILSQIENIITETNALEEVILEELGEKHYRELTDWKRDIEDEKQEYHNRQMKHVKHVTDELMHKRERIQKENERQTSLEQKRLHQEQNTQHSHAEAADQPKKKNIGYVPFVLPSNFILPHEAANPDETGAEHQNASELIETKSETLAESTPLPLPNSGESVPNPTATTKDTGNAASTTVQSVAITQAPVDKEASSSDDEDGDETDGDEEDEDETDEGSDDDEEDDEEDEEGEDDSEEEPKEQ